MLDPLLPIVIGIASGLAVQVGAIGLRWRLERDQYHQDVQLEHREVIAVIRAEMDWVREQLAEITRRFDDLPCGHHVCAAADKGDEYAA